MKTNRKIKTGIIAVAVMIGVLIPLTAFAASATSAADEALMQLQSFVNMAFGIVHAIFWPILLLIGSLMDNDLIFGPDIGERLRQIWVIMRNIVNISFVFVLLIAAFYNVTGFGGEGNFALKSILPKFVIALIAVNFSFLACKVILDASNVVATAVYDMASVAETTKPGGIKVQSQTEMCTNTAYLLCIGGSKKLTTTDTASAGAAASSDPAAAAADCATKYPPIWTYENAPAMQKLFCCETVDLKDTTLADGTTKLKDTACIDKVLQSDGSYKPVVLETVYGKTSSASGTVYPVFNSFGTDFFKKVDQNNIGIIMAINLGGINKLTNTAAAGDLTLKTLTMNGIFGIIMYLVFGFAYVALFCVLMARLVVLWFVIALSPIIALTTVMPQVGQYASELKLGEKFIQHLIAPIVIGLSMTIGYILIDAMQGTGAGGISLGGMGTASYSDMASGDQTGKFLSSNISDIHQLMLACLAVAIVWMGVFGAAEKTLASSITNKIKEAGTSAAKFVASLPKYAPVMPMMTGSKGMEQYSFSDITGILEKIKGAPAQLSSRKVDTWATASGFNDWVYPKMTEEFSKMLSEYKTETNAAKKGEKLKALLESSEINTPGNYDQVLAEMKKNSELDKVVPGTLEEFKTWARSGGGKAALKKAYGGQTSFDDLKVGEAVIPAATAAATFNTNVLSAQGADGKPQTPEAKAKLAVDKGLVNVKSANDQSLKTLITYLTANPLEAEAILKTDKDGKIDVKSSVAAIAEAEKAKAEKAKATATTATKEVVPGAPVAAPTPAAKPVATAQQAPVVTAKPAAATPATPKPTETETETKL